MANPMIKKVCPGCGKKHEIRSDRTYCSVECANKHKAKTKRDWIKTIVFGDVHIPFQCNRALTLMYDFIREEKPDRIVINGDFADCYGISRFVKDPLRGASFGEETKEVVKWLRKLREVAPHKEIIYIAGNHEHRLHKYLITEAIELRGVEGLSLPEQYKLDELKIEWVAPDSDNFVDNYIQLGKLLVGHFNRGYKQSGYTAKNLIDDYGISLIQAHVHSFGSHNRNLEHGEVMGWEGGCLCDLSPLYCKQKNWKHGFHVVWHSTKNDFFCVQPVGMVKHQFFYGGKLWQG